MTPATPVTGDTGGPANAPQQGAIVGVLTDGTGVSPFNVKKFIKDLVADMLLGGAAALVAVQVTDFGAAVATPEVAAFAVIGAGIRALYRAGLRWATTDA